MDTANRLLPSLQHNNLTLLSRLLNPAAENAELFLPADVIPEASAAGSCSRPLHTPSCNPNGSI